MKKTVKSIVKKTTGKTTSRPQPAKPNATKSKAGSTQASKTRKKQYRVLPENINDIIYEIDAQGVLLYVSPPVKNISGYDPAELIGKNFIELVYEDDRDLIIKRFTDVVKGIEGPFEYRFRIKSGESIWVWTKTNPIMKDGVFMGGRGLLVDINKRKLAENALKESEDKFRRITENMSDFVLEIDAQSIVKYVSPSHEKTFGKNVYYLIGVSVFDRIHPEDRDRVLAEFKEATRTKTDRESEYRILNEKNQYVWLHSSVHTIFGDAGEIVGNIINSHDITERKRMETDLFNAHLNLEKKVADRTLELEQINEKLTMEIMERIKSEERYRLLADNSTDVIWTMALDGTFTYSSPSIINLLGYTPEEALQIPLSEKLVESSAQRVIAIFADQLKKPPAERLQSSTFEVQQYCKDRTIKDVEITSGWLFDDRGAAIGIQGSSRDITYRKNAEKNLKESEEKYRSILENIDEMYFELDLKGNITFFNDSTCRISGYSPSEAMGMNYRQYTSPEITKQLKSLFGSIYMTEEKRSLADFKMITKDKITRDMELSVKLLKNPAGEIIGFGCIARDITERKLADDARRELESRFRAFVEQAPIAIGVFSLDGIGLQANKKFTELLGLQSIEEMVGRPAHTYFAPQFREQSKERTKRRLQGLPVPNEYESVALRTDGSEFPMHMTVAQVQLAGEKVSIAFMKDISERKQAEMVLRSSEEKYHNLYRNASIGIFHSTFEGRFLDVNPAVAKMLGYDTPEEVVRSITNIAEQVYAEPEIRDAVKADILKAGGVISTENLYRRKDGTFWYGRIHIRIVNDPQGKPSHFEGFIEDITQQKQAEEEKSKTEARYHTLFSRASDGIFMMTTEGKLVEVNESFALMHGYSVEEMLQMNLNDFDTPQTAQSVPDRMRRILAGESLVFEVEHYYKDGHVFSLEVSASMISSGDASYVLCFHRDITERKLVKQKLLKSEALFRAVVENSHDGIVLMTGKLQQKHLAMLSSRRIKW